MLSCVITNMLPINLTDGTLWVEHPDDAFIE